MNLSDKPLNTVAVKMKDSFVYPNATVGELAAFVPNYNLSSGATLDLLFEEISLPDGVNGFQFALFERLVVDIALGVGQSRYSTRANLLVNLLQSCYNRLDKRSLFCSRSINPIFDDFGKVSLFAYMVASPKSRGQVSLSANGDIVVQPKYLTNTDDIEAFGAAYRIAYETKLLVKGASESNTFVSILVDDAENKSDYEIGEVVKRGVVSPYHYAGTASIGNVVDNQLKVIGVNGLYVADASALPQTPRVNAMVCSMLIGRLAGTSFV